MQFDFLVIKDGFSERDEKKKKGILNSERRNVKNSGALQFSSFADRGIAVTRTPPTATLSFNCTTFYPECRESKESTLRKQNGNPHCLTPSQAVDHDRDFSKDKSQLLPRKMFPFNPIQINLVLE